MLDVQRGTQVETSPGFDRNWYRVQMVLQVVLALLLLLGLIGLFGNGWLSTSVVRIGAADVTYERFTRKTVPFRLTVRSSEQRPGPVRLTLGRELIDRTGIVRTIPAATAVKDTAEGTEYTFAAQDRRTELVLSLQPDRWGWFSWTLRIDGVGEASLFQIIYP
jgi:hypothetical protein